MLRLVLCVFALALLGRMPLRTRITDYGFTAALPAFLVTIDLLAGQLPAWLDGRGRNGAAMRGTAVGASAALLTIYLAIMAVHVDEQTVNVGAGHDRFLADARGSEINAALNRLQQFPPKQTLAVFPQGRMLNYLSRRENPVWLGDFMPPEILSVGEAAALEALRRNPPDIVILTGKDVRDGSFFFPIGDYHYGQPTLNWIISHYRRIDSVPSDGELQFEFLQRQDPVQP
jgi:hypothetical protein